MMTVERPGTLTLTSRVSLCVVTLLTLLAFGSGCEREDRNFRPIAPASAAVDPVSMSALQPGTPTAELTLRGPYAENAYAIAEGKLLYSYFNCVGCHAHGGGGIGPPLMDEEWIYGSEPENIFATIVQGRPNGMPSFRGRIPDDRIWMLVAYVRSMSGLVRQDARPGRNDAMHSKVPEQMKTEEAARSEAAAHPPDTREE